MMRRIYRGLATALAVSAVVSGPVRADLAPAGAGLTPNVLYSHPYMPTPPGQYRTRIAWLVASMIAFENQGYFAHINPLAPTPTLYRTYLDREKTYIRGLSAADHYRYIDAAVRDFAQMQIVTLQNSQMEMALGTVPSAIFADAATALLSTGVSFLSPASRTGVDALEAGLLDRGTRETVIRRFDLSDLNVRYSGFVDAALFEQARQQLASGVSADEAAKLLAESITSTGIGTAVNSYSAAPSQLLDMFRTQMVKEVATFGCADVLNRNVDAHITSVQVGSLQAFWRGTGDYLTPLALLLAQQSSPNVNNPVNVLSRGSVRSLLAAELAKLKSLGASSPAKYGAYLRRLLVDLEALEKAEIAALQSGATMQFIESTALNVLFGAMGAAAGGSLGAQAVATLGNAGYGAFDTYMSVSDELKIRMQMAAFREVVLNQMMPLADTCAFGSGVVVVPETALHGAQPDSQ